MADKLTHAAVGFEHPAKGDHHCSQCAHYEGFSCDIVKSPIRPGDWCEKFEAKNAAAERANHA